MGWASGWGCTCFAWQPCSPAVSLGGSPKCLARDLHMVLESSLGAGCTSLTCHCQETGRGWAGWGRGQWSPGCHNSALLVPSREFSKEPELMPKTPSQKNRRKKKRISYVQDENRDPIRKRYEGPGAVTSQRRVI